MLIKAEKLLKVCLEIVSFKVDEPSFSFRVCLIALDLIHTIRHGLEVFDRPTSRHHHSNGYRKYVIKCEAIKVSIFKSHGRPDQIAIIVVTLNIFKELLGCYKVTWQLTVVFASTNLHCGETFST